MAVNPMTEEREDLGPNAHGDPMGTPAADEKVLWKGQPDLAVLSRSAFHTRKVGIYFLVLIGISVTIGNTNAAVICTLLGIAGVGILHTLAWVSRRTTMYILTDTRLILRIGMAIETRINIPLKHILSADLKDRGGNRADIALQLGGERLLGYFLLWPHARPWRFAQPEPMLRAVPDAEKVAALLAEACAKVAPIQQNLTEINVPSRPKVQQTGAKDIEHGRMEGAPA